MILRNASQKNFERLSREPQKFLEKPSSKASLRSLEKLSSKTSLKGLEKSVNSLGKSSKQSSQKNLEEPPRKPSMKSLEKQTRKSSRQASKISIDNPPRKVSKAILVKPSKESSLKSKEKPTRKVSNNSLEKSTIKSQNNLKMPPNKPSQKTVEKKPRKAPQKSLKRLPNNVSEKRVKKPSRKALENILEKQSSEVSQKIKNVSKVIGLSPQKNSGSSSKALASKPSNCCVICKKNFSSKKNLTKHKKKHHFLRHCPNCPKTFQQTRKFIYHLRSHLEDHPYECKICLESFNQQKDLLAHKVVHRNSSRLCCDVCPEVFPHLASLNRHRLAHCGPPYTCDECGAKFSNVPDRTVHSKNHVLRCVLCPKEVVAFPSNLDLASHMYKVHRTEECNLDGSEVMDTCEPCVSTGAVNLEDDNNSDSMDDSLLSDFESDVDEDSNYRADAVESVYNLKRKDKFICFICYDLYPSCELLKCHMRAHNWYPCNSCPRYFPDADTLNKHKCDFAEESSFRCPNCNSECENCKITRQAVVAIPEDDFNGSQSVVPVFQELPTSAVTNYTDIAQRNRLNNFIQYIKSHKGPLDLKSFNLIGYHCTILEIITKNESVKCLFPSQYYDDFEELYLKFQNLSRIVLNRINQSSAQ